MYSYSPGIGNQWSHFHALKYAEVIMHNQKKLHYTKSIYEVMSALYLYCIPNKLYIYLKAISCRIMNGLYPTFIVEIIYEL